MRGRSISRPAAVVVLLVVASTLIRFVAAERVSVPWIAPDEMLYGLLGESFWTTGRLEIRGAAAPYFSLLTPVLVGAALAGRDLVDGIERAQLLQSAAMSSAAVPVFLWAKRLCPPWWAVAAAALTLAGPVLSYSGLLMTEALFYPASAWALFALAATLERPTVAHHGWFLLAVTVAAAVRMQALVLLPAFVLAALLYDRQRPGEGRLRAVAPLASGIAIVICGLALVRIVAPTALGSGALLGAYATLGETTSIQGGVVAMVSWHLGAVALVSLVAPFVATALVVIEALRGRLASAPIGAAAAAIVGYVPLLVAQVGVFAVDRLDHVSQRYLVSAVPALVVGLVAWIGAGAPRPRLAVGAVGAGTLLLVAGTPVERLLPATAMHDALSTAALLHLEGRIGIARVVVLALTVLAILLVALLPRRLLPVLVIVLLGGFVATSVDAARVVERLSATESADAFGGQDPSWIDSAGLDGVTLLATGQRPDEAEARTVFWNRGIREVLRLTDVRSSVPPNPAVAVVDVGSGLLTDVEGRPVERRLDRRPADLRVRRRTGRVRRSRIVDLPAACGVEGRVTAPRRVGDLGPSPERRLLGHGHGRGARMCRRRPRGDVDREVRGSDRPGRRRRPAGHDRSPSGSTPTIRLATPAGADGSRPCTFTLHTGGYAGSTRIAFVPRP